MKLNSLAKYVDQPIVLNSLQKKMPAMLIGGAAAFGIYDTLRIKEKEKRKTQTAKNAIIMTATIAASLIGTRGLKLNNKQVIKGLMENKSINTIIEAQTSAVNKYLKNKNLNKELTDILHKAKANKLSVDEIETLTKKLPGSTDKKELFKTILPDPENLNSKEIFSEIKRLSLLGLIPVIGGITGGIIADKASRTGSKKSTANKIKEGFYQYFANIFLCNVGAGAALFASERLQHAGIIKQLTPIKKLGVILSGIVTTGIIGGSFIANYMSKKIIDPIFEPKLKNRHKPNEKELYSERKPELLDIALHIDDIATAGVLSGFKWIEPVLPFMYFISGYRAGTGYRNGKKKHAH